MTVNNFPVPSSTASPSTITVLTAFSNNTVKRFELDGSGALISIPYGLESHFHHQLVSIADIRQLGRLVAQCSETQNTILIRGQAIPNLPTPIRRRMENFPEPSEGCHWVMIDFDDIPLPNGIVPTSREAIEHVVGQLPQEFHGVTYYFQFSSSAGIVRPDGTPLKLGLNAHLFFWLNRPTKGTDLSAYFQLHCINTGFYEKTLDRAGHPRIKLGVDIAVIRTSIQPNYVGLPIVGTGVVSTIAQHARQGFVEKNCEGVTLPELDTGIVQKAKDVSRQLDHTHKRELGFSEARIVSRASGGGISVSNYYRSTGGTSPSINRTFTEAVPYNEQDMSIVLHFEDESSPGSWYVTKASPQIARRFGDGSTLPLKELSEGAYEYVRDTKKWFTEIVQQDGLALTAEGYLPDIQSFVVNVRNALIESPTGSGKTTSFCRFAQANRTNVILYAAQTIALTRQMRDDLATAQVPVVHYADFSMGSTLSAGVYVTTNESLSKFIEAAIDQGVDYILVIDEVHQALDDFMGTDRKNQLLEQAIGRAQRCLFMTATITPLQITKLVDTVSRACGALTPAVYAGYRFTPVKSNPLILQQVAKLGAHLVALLRQYKALKAAGQQIPRTVIITPTSKMRVFEKLLEHFELTADAQVVSRQESTPADIEEARTSNKPILIASPMFALGLNFDVQAARFWTFFSYLDVDTSQIIQTLNRANRGNVSCEVRLYHGAPDTHPIQVPSAVQERMRIEGYLLDETSVQGMLDAYFHVDRPVYNSLRRAEKQTSKALGQLIEHDQIQNYRIVQEFQETLDIAPTDEGCSRRLNIAPPCRLKFDPGLGAAI